MKHIIPQALQIGDVVCTTDMSPIADIIRYRTWGKKTWFNLSLGTHVGIICDRGGGLFYVSEMLGNGLNMSELSRYDNGACSWFNHFTRVGRYPIADVQRTAMNDYIIKIHSFGVKYGYEGYKLICSQWVKEVFNAVSLPAPVYDAANPFVTPADWQRWTELSTIEVLR